MVDFRANLYPRVFKSFESLRFLRKWNLNADLFYFFRRVLLYSSEYYRRHIAIFTRVKSKSKA